MHRLYRFRQQYIDLDLVMPKYNLSEYSSDYSDITGSLWFH